MWLKESILDDAANLLPNPYDEEEEDVIESRLAPFDSINSVNSDRSVSEQAVQSGEEDNNVNRARVT